MTSTPRFCFENEVKLHLLNCCCSELLSLFFAYLRNKVSSKTWIVAADILGNRCFDVELFFVRGCLSENINEYNSVNYYDDSIKAWIMETPFHQQRNETLGDVTSSLRISFFLSERFTLQWRDHQPQPHLWAGTFSHIRYLPAFDSDRICKAPQRLLLGNPACI